MGARSVTKSAAVIAVLVLLVLLATVGCDKKGETSTSTASPQEKAPSVGTASAGGARVVVGEHGFDPTSLVVPKGGAGATVAVTFLRTTDETCAKEVIFPDVGIKKDLPLKTPVTVDVPADTARTLTFQCGMAMYKGALVVK
jgi:plastocyanin domain-containing protein